MPHPSLREFERLLEIMKRLRKDCPWDKEQDFTSLVPHSIEEIFELADAIYNKDVKGIQEELGDLFMHLVFYVLIAQEQEQFDLNSVLYGINEKLIFRHPHIFKENQSLATAQEVLKTWQSMKKKEGKEFALSGIAKGLPAITKAFKIQQKARDNQFDFEHIGQVIDKCKEEWNELEEAIQQYSNIEEEFGDVLFAYVNYARFLNIDPELALQKANQKFIHRFTEMERIAQHNKQSIADLSFEKKEQLWQEAKQRLYKKDL